MLLTSFYFPLFGSHQQCDWKIVHRCPFLHPKKLITRIRKLKYEREKEWHLNIYNNLQLTWLRIPLTWRQRRCLRCLRRFRRLRTMWTCRHRRHLGWSSFLSRALRGLAGTIDRGDLGTRTKRFSPVPARSRTSEWRNHDEIDRRNIDIRGKSVKTLRKRLSEKMN